MVPVKSADLEHLKELLDRACEKPQAERRAFLQTECQGRPELLAEALDLIGFEQTTADDLVAPTTVLLPDMVGKTIGSYHLVELLGEGGMGVVYLAEQQYPLKRQVAFKIIKLGMDTREVIARFESERQVLALMDHPNIARVLDAGATEEGRPFFVMEYIEGTPITSFCDDGEIGIRERLYLFIQVCRAINHAHQKGVIHRDVKPTNILITTQEGQPVPKVIDFGVAKAVETRMDGMTALTQLGRLVGTLEYMSPEQADAATGDVDTRSDVYSLGVVLYELLTSALPIAKPELLEAGLEGIRHRLQAAEPRQPSTAPIMMA